MKLRAVERVRVEYCTEKKGEECTGGKVRALEYTFDPPRDEFWSDLFTQVLDPAADVLGKIERIRGLTAYGEEGGYCSNPVVLYTRDSKSMRLTVACSFTWIEPEPMTAIQVIARRPGTAGLAIYFHANLPEPVSVPAGTSVSVSYDVNVFLADYSLGGQLSGFDPSLLGLFDHVCKRLKGETAVKAYLARARFRDVTGAQGFAVPLDRDVATWRLYRYGFSAPSRIDGVAWVEVDAYTGTEYLPGFISFYQADLQRRPYILSGQPVSVEVSFEVT